MINLWNIFAIILYVFYLANRLGSPEKVNVVSVNVHWQV